MRFVPLGIMSARCEGLAPLLITFKLHIRERNLPTTCLAEDLSLILYVFGGTRINIFKCYTVTKRERQWGKVC